MSTLKDPKARHRLLQPADERACSTLAVRILLGGDSTPLSYGCVWVSALCMFPCGAGQVYALNIMMGSGGVSLIACIEPLPVSLRALFVLTATLLWLNIPASVTADQLCAAVVYGDDHRALGDGGRDDLWRV